MGDYLSTLKSCGKDVRIAESTRIKRPYLVTIGSHVAIDDFVVITTRAEIGSYVHISSHVSIIGGQDAYFKAGNFCTISAGCRIICCGDSFSGDGLVSVTIPPPYRDRLINKPVTMQDFSSLASNVVVVPGVTIGEGAVVGAGSYVSHDIPAWQIWWGTPAKFIVKRPQEKMKAYARELGF